MLFADGRIDYFQSPMRLFSASILISCLTLLVACGPSLQVTKLPGASRGFPQVRKTQVAVYKNESAISCDYQRVAFVSAKARGESSQATLIGAARKKAGKMGANAVIIEAVRGNEVKKRSSGGFTWYGPTYSSSQVTKRGKGQFLAVHEDRPCESASKRKSVEGQSASGLPVHFSEVNTSLEEALSLPKGAKKVKSSEVKSLQEGDVIISIEGAKLTQEDSLQQVIAQHSPGDMVQLGILREGENRTVSVTLGGSINE